MQRFCLALDLREDPELIAEYVAQHRAVWPEVLASLSASGVLQMQIFQLGTRLCMLLEADDEFSFARKAAMDVANPHVQEWESLMNRFQDVEGGSSPAAKWKPMEQIFNLQQQSRSR